MSEEGQPMTVPRRGTTLKRAAVLAGLLTAGTAVVFWRQQPTSP